MRWVLMILAAMSAMPANAATISEGVDDTGLISFYPAWRFDGVYSVELNRPFKEVSFSIGGTQHITYLEPISGEYLGYDLPLFDDIRPTPAVSSASSFHGLINYTRTATGFDFSFTEPLETRIGTNPNDPREEVWTRWHTLDPIDIFFDAGDPVAYRLSFTASAIPEPATWAMMIVGFGMVGGMVRHRVGSRSIAA